MIMPLYLAGPLVRWLELRYWALTDAVIDNFIGDLTAISLLTRNLDAFFCICTATNHQ